jgi:hypothetical protein
MKLNTVNNIKSWEVSKGSAVLEDVLDLNKYIWSKVLLGIPTDPAFWQKDKSGTMYTQILYLMTIIKTFSEWSKTSTGAPAENEKKKPSVIKGGVGYGITADDLNGAIRTTTQEAKALNEIYIELCEEYATWRKTHEPVNYKYLDDLFISADPKRADADLKKLTTAWKGILMHFINWQKLKKRDEEIDPEKIMGDYINTLNTWQVGILQRISQQSVFVSDDERYGVCVGCNHRRRY